MRSLHFSLSEYSMHRFSLLLLVLLMLLAGCRPAEPVQVLVFTGTKGFQHGATPSGVEAIREIAEELDVQVTVADSAQAISEPNLRSYRAVVFLNTSGDVLDYSAQADLQRFIQAGGGFLGVHSAADTERNWDWYGHLVGAYAIEPISEYPRMTPAALSVAAEHPSTDSIPSTWNRTDAWYRFDAMAQDVTPLLMLQHPGLPGGSQPVAWYHEFDGGRAFYTALGHDPQVFRTAAFRAHLRGGLEYVLGDREALDYARVRTLRPPEENRFSRTILADSLDEPTELETLGDGRVLFVERKGAVKLYDPTADSVRTIARLDVHTEFEDGLMGVALDPNFTENRWVYMYYSPAGGAPRQHLSRFELRGDSLVLDSEEVMLVVPTQREECCHTGGSIEFGPDGNLFLSTGDNTNPFESDGFAPIDERPGREPFDAQRTSANTNDLRGKILRITPQDDGSYTIPEGNLFPEGTPDTRPEIYVMGNRNPYRIHIDQKTGYLYWGEVGPDAAENDSSRGPRGHDEVNQARSAGFYGWPYFVGDNKPYRDYDFATGESGPAFDPQTPINESRNNTGLRELPPAQPAFVWYPYDVSPEFPIVGTGGRNAMAGPVFYRDLFATADHTFPEYFDGRLFIYDWIRGWVLVATMDGEGDLLRLEPFMPSTRWHNAIDMALDEHGVMYVIEYGTGWFTRNPDARLNLVEFNSGNRAPIAAISAEVDVVPVPSAVSFTAGGSSDPDGDPLRYSWEVAGETHQTDEPSFTYTFEQAGEYPVELTVSDEAGESASAKVVIQAGNAPPSVDLQISGNQSFYWDGRRFNYSVLVEDPEDGRIDEGAISTHAVYVGFDYVEDGADSEMLEMGHQVPDAPVEHAQGLRLIEQSDCQACHSRTARSIGPSYVDVAVRYQDEPEAVNYLSGKIIQGGGGVWGEQVMSAHPQLTQSEAASMVEYILSLASDSAEVVGMPLNGEFVTTPAEDSNEYGAFVLRARYTDSGAPGAPPSMDQDIVVLRHPRIQAEEFDDARSISVFRGRQDAPTLVGSIYDGSYLVFRDLDLTGLDSASFRLVHDPLHATGGRIELRLDDPMGDLVGTADAALEAYAEGPREVTAAITPADGRHDVYVVFRNDRGVTPEALFMLDWIQFEPRGGDPS